MFVKLKKTFLKYIYIYLADRVEYKDVIYILNKSNINFVKVVINS